MSKKCQKRPRAGAGAGQSLWGRAHFGQQHPPEPGDHHDCRIALHGNRTRFPEEPWIRFSLTDHSDLQILVPSRRAAKASQGSKRRVLGHAMDPIAPKSIAPGFVDPKILPVSLRLIGNNCSIHTQRRSKIRKKFGMNRHTTCVEETVSISRSLPRLTSLH